MHADPDHVAGNPAPAGPLLGSELAWAIELLTDKQYRAYRYRREGQAWNWIARRMGVSRPAVIHLVAKAEKCLGYTPTVTPRQRTPYKNVATRKAEQESAFYIYVRELLEQMPPADRRRLVRILETSTSDEEAQRRLAKRLRYHRRERVLEQKEQWDEVRRENDGLTGRHFDTEDESGEARHRGADGYATVMEDAGLPSVKPADLVIDDGKGYNRL